MRHLRIYILCFLTATAGLAHASESEARLKTAFLYQFTKYIDWPTSELPESFHIAVIGSTEVMAYLSTLAREKRIKDRPITVKHIQTPEELGTAQLVFLAGDNANFLESLLARIGSGATLVVTEANGFAQRGATLNFFFTVDGKLRFEANRKAAEKRKLVLSSQLLKMASLVEE